MLRWLVDYVGTKEEVLPGEKKIDSLKAQGFLAKTSFGRVESKEGDAVNSLQGNSRDPKRKCEPSVKNCSSPERERILTQRQECGATAGTSAPFRNLMNDNLANLVKEQNKRLSRRNFDTEQYRTEAKAQNYKSSISDQHNVLEKAKDERGSSPLFEEEDNSSAYDQGICQLMNELYSSPAKSKGKIQKILLSVF